jgi:hypothetical protein
VELDRSLSTAVDLAAAAQCRSWATELEQYGARWLAEEEQAERELAEQQAAWVEAGAAGSGLVTRV